MSTQTDTATQPLSHVIAYIDWLIDQLAAERNQYLRSMGMSGKLYDPEYKYVILEKGTGKVVAFAKTRETAARCVDRNDNKYGSYHYTFEEKQRYIGRVSRESRQTAS